MQKGRQLQISHDKSINLATDSPADQFKKSWLKSHSLQVDSGAAKTISGDLSIIEDYKAYTNPIFMYTITGSRMSILGESHIGNCLSQVFYSPEADCTVVATKDLQKQGLMTVFPPGENQG